MARRLYRRRDAAREIGVIMRNNGQLKGARRRPPGRRCCCSRLTDKIETTVAASRSATVHREKRSEFLQLPLWPAMTRRSGSHDRGDGDGTACERSRGPENTRGCCGACLGAAHRPPTRHPRTVRRCSACSARCVGAGWLGVATGHSPAHPVATTTAANCPSRQHRGARHRALKVHPRPRDDR
jgi:hypothetical protein